MKKTSKNTKNTKRKFHKKNIIVVALTLISLLCLIIAAYTYINSRTPAKEASNSAAVTQCNKLLNAKKYDDLYLYLNSLTDFSSTFTNASDVKKFTGFMNIYDNYLNYKDESSHFARCTYYGEYEIYLKWSLYYASMSINKAQSIIDDSSINGNKSAFANLIQLIKSDLKNTAKLNDTQISEVSASSTDDSDFFTPLAANYMESLKANLDLKEYENH